jgi:hypothetical protein
MTSVIIAVRSVPVMLAESTNDYLLAGILTVAAALIVVVLMLATSESSESEEDQGS